MAEIEKIQAYLSETDPVLSRIIESIEYPHLEPTGNVFHDLMSLIIEQQIHYRSTKKTFRKLLDKAGIKELTVENFHLLEASGFESARLSLKKFQTMHSIIELFSSERIPWSELSNDEVRTKLKKIAGIGDKTIDSLLIYSLQRDDVFICDDYHIQKILPPLYGLEIDKKLKTKIKKLAERWKPFSSYAFRYLLAWKENGNKK